jgi:hypothetical protein
MTGLSILLKLVRESVAREQCPRKPIFSSATFAVVLAEEFDLVAPPAVEAIERILAKVPTVAPMQDGFWLLRGRPSMLK